MKHTILISIIIISAIFIVSCGKSDKQTSDNGQRITQTDPAKLKTVEYKTKGMTCTGCEETIKERVKKVNGVQEVEADYKLNKAKVTYDTDKTNPKQIEEAIVDAGYKVLETIQ
jgi:copper chaperone CopZ